MDNNLLLTVGTQLLPLYEKYFLVKLDGYRFTNDRSFSRAPITFKSKKHIILNCDPNCDCQIAFQLSHELCHATIPENVPNNLRWLEETFAILASRYFPYKIRCIDPSEYKAYFNQSFLRLQAKCKINLEHLSKETIRFLESGSGTENYNDYGSYLKIGERFLPAVEDYPHFWECIPYLCKISPGLSLHDSFTEWRSLVPSNIRHLITVIESALLLR